MDINSSLAPLLYFNDQVATLSTKTFTGTGLSISENVRSQGQMSKSSHDQIWTKLQLWSHSEISI